MSTLGKIFGAVQNALKNVTGHFSDKRVNYLDSFQTDRLSIKQDTRVLYYLCGYPKLDGTVSMKLSIIGEGFERPHQSIAPLDGVICLPNEEMYASVDLGICPKSDFQRLFADFENGMPLSDAFPNLIAHNDLFRNLASNEALKGYAQNLGKTIIQHNSVADPVAHFATIKDTNAASPSHHPV